jgi:hypothetical protein
LARPPLYKNIYPYFLSILISNNKLKKIIKMSLGNLIIDIYQNIININGKKILVLIDKNNKIV